MVTEQEIMQIFSPFGMVTGIDMPKEGNPPVTKGFAFVEYAQQGSADKAIQVLQDFFLNGRRMRVGQPTAQKRQTASPGVIPQMAQTMPSGGGVSSDPAAVMSAAERRRIAVSNIPQDTQQASIQTIFQTFGMITRVDVIPDASATLVHSGTFVVEFASEASAAQAFQAMQGFKLGGISLSLYRGNPPPRSAPPAAAAAAAAPLALASLPANIKVLMLENLVGPGEADEDLAEEVKEECARFGKVLKIKMHEVGKEKNVRVFVKFSEESAGGKAGAALNGRWFGKRKVRATSYDVDAFRAGELEQ